MKLSALQKCTLITQYDLGHVPKPPRLQGNNFLRQKGAVRTTSQVLHAKLDHRYIRYDQKGSSLHGTALCEKYRTYVEGLAKNVAKYVVALGSERPLLREEFCCHLDDKRDADKLDIVPEQILKRRRRYTFKQAPRENEYGRSSATWHVVLRTLNARVPKGGNHIIPPEDGLIESIQALVPDMRVHHAEACRGVNRLRVPIGKYDPKLISHRFTIVINRNTGEVEPDTSIEHWASLPKYKQNRAGKPAKMALTVYGCVPRETPVEPPSSDVMMPNTTSDVMMPETTVSSTESRRLEPKLAWGPPPVANHGPGFSRLSAQEQSEMRQLHHNLGHPDPQKFMRYLKQGGAGPEVLKAALDFQCDACTESRKGFNAARPSAIHENIAFNTKVGMDLVTWRNAKGRAFHFVHFIDEATLFHIGVECGPEAGGSGAEEIIRHFESCWVTWAGPPREVYVDPGGEFVSDAWALRMQEAGIVVRMSAGDSHWQLGRCEIHGCTVKRMLSRMDLEKEIGSSVEFQAALRQVFNAKNSLCRADGYTPQQSVLGVSCRLPGSLLSDSDAAAHALAESQTPEGERFLETLRLRESARRAFIQVDNSSSFRRALLRRTRPSRMDWEVGDMVLYWRRKGANMRREHGRWHGPAEIISIEKQRVVWLSHAGRLIRASPEQIRAASLREWHYIPKNEDGIPLDTLKPLKEKLKGAPLFVDLEGGENPSLETTLEELLPEETPAPDISSEPESEAHVESNPPNEGPEVDSPSIFPPPLSPEEQERHERSREIPVPSSPGPSSDVEFGDDEDMDDAFLCGSEMCWEIDVTPPETWNLPEQVDEDMICLASESRKKRVEVKLRDLTVKDQKRFAAAKHKEVSAWLSHKTVRQIAKGRIPQRNIMRCRWIYTWKTVDPSKQDAAATDGKKAKARLVVLGFEDPDLDSVPNDAPTLSKDGRQLILQKISSNRWRLCSFDISTAFLHGKGDGRLLGIQAPPEIKEALALGPGDDCELVGGAYGRIDAPYLWYQELRKALVELGFHQCPLDPCVFSLSSQDAGGQYRSHGVLGIHVDDGICGGDDVFHETLEKLRKRFSFGSFETGSFVFTGIKLHQWDDMSIEMDQRDYVESIDPINVPRDRRRTPDAQVTAEEKQRYRQLIGSLQYAAVHTRADLSAKVGELQSAVNQARVSHLLEANRVLQEAKQHPVSLMIVPINEADLTFCAFSDASFASNLKTNAHQGTVIFSTSPELLENHTALVCPVAWSSKKIPRVVRSTLGAEAIALSNTVDRLSWIRIMWAWLKDHQTEWHDPAKVLAHQPTAAAVTDCKSVFDIVTRTATPQCEEHRTTIECLLIRQRMKENCKLRWVASGAMLADCLTKTMDSSRLRECLRTGKYALYDEGMILRQRADKRKQLQWLKAEPQSSVEPCLYGKHEHNDFWRVDQEKGYLERVHRCPRRERFTPIGVSECPVDFKNIGVQRTTFANLSSGKRCVASDIWVGEQAYTREPEYWTGITRFELESETPTISSFTS